MNSLTPSIAIAFDDFLSEIDVNSVQVTLVDAGGTSVDISGDLTISASGASGTLSAALSEDSSYTLNVSGS